VEKTCEKENKTTWTVVSPWNEPENVQNEAICEKSSHRPLHVCLHSARSEKGGRGWIWRAASAASGQSWKRPSWCLVVDSCELVTVSGLTRLIRERRMEPALVEGPNMGYAYSALSATAFAGVNALLLRRVVPRSARNSAQQEWKWRNTANSLLHSFLTGTWALYW